MADDELLLFDPDQYGRGTKRRARRKVETIQPVPYRPGWYRVRQAKGPIAFWHLIARSVTGEGSYATICGKVGLPISHSTHYDGSQMVECPACAAAPPAVIYYPPLPSQESSRQRHPSAHVGTRRDDPAQSHDAAESVTGLTTQLQLSAIARTIEDAGPNGLTDEELCRELLGTGWADSGIRTRRQVLAGMAVIAWNGTTRPSIRGRQMRVWVHAEHRSTA